jgi:uncharacterized protein (DUF885 family)
VKLRLFLLALLLLPASAGGGRVGGAAAGNVRERELRQVLHDHWQWTQQVHPSKALAAGDVSAATRFENRSPDNRARQRREAAGLLVQLKGIDKAALSVSDRETALLLERSLTVVVEAPICSLDRWLVTARRNPFQEATRAATSRAGLSGLSAVRLVARVKRLPTQVEHEIRGLRLGIASGRVPDRGSLERLVASLEVLQALPLDQWALTRPAREPHPDWRAEVVAAFATELMAAARESAVPALQSYLSFLRQELLPEARTAEIPGLAGLAGGEACYQERIQWHTTLPFTAGELHSLGLLELDRIHAALLELGQGLFGTIALGPLLERLRSDPVLHYTSAEEIEDDARDAVREAWGALRRGFSRRPRVSVVVESMPLAWAAQTSAAYYVAPPTTGDRPGRYVVNTSRPETRARYESRALAFHEAVPGHHLQSTLGALDRALPAFRRSVGPTVLVEGWALYAEGLAQELGLYPTALDQVGRYTMEALRAARLVVDTGLHHKAWSRGQAVEFLVANTVLTQETAQVEVERYLSRPGQALAYQVGAREIRALRTQAEQDLGPGFELKQFHQVVLLGGAVTVPLLRERVAAWVAESR